MDINLSRIWASPSTLHLRLLYGASDGSWVRSRELHVGWEVLPPETRRQLMMALGQDREGTTDEEDVPLF